MKKRPAMLSLLLMASMEISGAELDQFIPEDGVILGEVMELGVTAELQTLIDRKNAAVAQNSEWLRNYAQQYSESRGELPYHPNFGLTEAEYGTLVELAEAGNWHGWTLHKVGEVRIEVRRSSFGNISFLGEPTDFILNSVTVHPSSGSVSTPFGVLSEEAAIDQRDPDMPWGRWVGYSWEWVHPISKEGWSDVRFSIGKRSDFEDGIISYEVNYSPKGEDPQEHSIIIVYPLK